MSTIVKLQKTIDAQNNAFELYYICIATTLNGIYTTQSQALITKEQYLLMKGNRMEIMITKTFYETTISQ